MRYRRARVGSAAPENAEGYPTGSGKKSNVITTTLLLAVLWRGSLGLIFSVQVVENWSTIFISLTLQALPFLVLGVLTSAAVSSLVPASFFARVVPVHPMLAIPAAGAAGALLPGCECSSVPVAGRLVSRGVPQAAALTFLLAAPAINPVVVVATAVAFPGRPQMVLARFVASFVTAVVIGSIWSRFASPGWMESRLWEHHEKTYGHAFVETAMSDFVQAGSYLVLGAMLVATAQTIVPRGALNTISGHGALSIVVLSGLAVVLSICSEADAFVAAGLTQFSLTSRLAFLVVGPMVDLKLIALQVGTFGRSFATRFAPLTFVTGVFVSVLIGTWIL
jgi:uncharacterized membrane protein YraQ (UPF0718 family)